jgi:phage anti-repressor protein
MKLTEFLKKYSLIDNKFIDDFYSFYDEGLNEFDYSIDLEKIAFWLNVTKGNLKILLESNFDENEDYIISEIGKGKDGGKGGANKETIMLRYNCAKELCMLSRSEKSSVIRKFYIDLEKLIITYKDSIVRDLNNQLGINQTNKQLIEKYKNKGLIYVLKIDDSSNISTDKPMEVKIGSTEDLEQRMKQYNVGRVNELPLVLVWLSDQIEDLETCIKQNLKSYQIKHKTESFEIDLDFIKKTMKYCTEKNALLLKRNNKLLNEKDNSNKSFLIIIDKENLDRVDDILIGIRNIKKKRELKKASKKKLDSKQSDNKTLKKTCSKKTCSKKKSSKKVSRPKKIIDENLNNTKKLGRPRKIKTNDI